jgi:Na+-driven multidrug efflux pump
MRLHLRLAGEMFAIGLAPFFIHVCASVVTILMNWQLKTHGGTPAIASYGIVAAINSLVISMILGLTHGMQPIVGFNYGAGHRDRALQTYRLTVLCATILCALCFAAVELAPTDIASAFTDDPVLTAGTTVALRLCCAMMLTLGFQVVTSNFFQSIGKARIAIFLSLSRQIIFLLPFLWLLPPAFGVMGAWYATPAADLCACAVTAVILFVFMRKRYWKTVN